MHFILGIIVGLLIANVIAMVLTYFRKPIVKAFSSAEKHIDAVAQGSIRRHGMVVFPDDESDEAREKIIQKNNAQGKDTPVSELL